MLGASQLQCPRNPHDQRKMRAFLISDGTLQSDSQLRTTSCNVQFDATNSIVSVNVAVAHDDSSSWKELRRSALD